VDCRIKALVGDITEEQLRFVEVFLASHLGLFVPVLGQCGYAITEDHTHPSWMVLVSCTDIALVGMATVKAPPGYHLRIMAPGVPHQEQVSDEPNRYYAVMIASSLFRRAADALGIDAGRFAWEPYPASERLLHLIRDLMREHDLKSPLEVLDSIAALTVHELLRCTQPGTASSALAVPEAALRNVVEAMEHRFGYDWKLAELARLAGMSTSTFQRAFKASLNCAPITYLSRIRIRRAQHLLRSGSSVSRAARATGFASVSHFSETFRRVAKLTPLQYRQRHLSAR
jgi:AraC family transcriptional regulator